MAVPRELHLDAVDGGFGVTIRRSEMRWSALPLLAAFPVGLHWVCTRSPMLAAMDWLVSAVTLLVGLFLVGLFVLDRIGRRRLEVRGDHVDYFLRTPFGDLLRNRIDAHDIAQATIRRDPHGRPELAIDARESLVEIGGGLSFESLEWLRSILVSGTKAQLDVRAGAPVSTAG